MITKQKVLLWKQLNKKLPRQIIHTTFQLYNDYKAESSFVEATNKKLPRQIMHTTFQLYNDYKAESSFVEAPNCKKLPWHNNKYNLPAVLYNISSCYIW